MENTSGNAGLAAIAPKQTKNVNISQADNGYIITLRDTDTGLYTTTTKIATTLEEIAAMIGTYFEGRF